MVFFVLFVKFLRLQIFVITYILRTLDFCNLLWNFMSGNRLISVYGVYQLWHSPNLNLCEPFNFPSILWWGVMQAIITRHSHDTCHPMSGSMSSEKGPCEHLKVLNMHATYHLQFHVTCHLLCYVTCPLLHCHHVLLSCQLAAHNTYSPIIVSWYEFISYMEERSKFWLFCSIFLC